MPSSKAKSWEAQLMALRALTESTGALHEAQVFNLRQWGAIAFQHVGAGRWEARVDVPGRTVTYVLRPTKKARRPDNLPNLIASLVRSVCWLLGPAWVVRVTERGKVIFQGERQDERDTGTGNRAGSRPA